MRSLLLFWFPWALRMERPGVKLTYATLPSIFCSKPKRHSESLIRNIKENEASPSRYQLLCFENLDLFRSNSLDLERRLHHYMASTGLINGLGPLGAPHSQVAAPVDIGQQATLLILQRIYHELKVLNFFKIIQRFQVITKRMVENDREEQGSQSWKFAAMVVDRLCLYIFTVFIFASTIGIFWSAPYLVA